MTPVKQGKYEFKKDSLINVRKQMGISQSKMAELLGVPANTLSRWELGTTTPDAKHLAAFYSVAKEYGITVSFFGLQGNVKPFQYNLIVIWDFQTTGSPAPWVQYAHDAIMSEFKKRFAGMIPIFKAFTHPTQTEAAKVLKSLDWRITEGGNEVYDYIVEDAKSDSGHNPESSVLVLISSDNGFIDLIEELKSKGVQVYIVSPQTFNNKLIQTVGPANSIPWYPVYSEQPKRPLKDVPGFSYWLTQH
jgi:transcriptional regulator with XRE-family HTH domain